MKQLMGVLVLMAVMMITFGFGCSSDDSQESAEGEATSTETETTATETETTATESEATVADNEMVTTESDLRYIDLKVGEGVPVENGMNVDVHYTLWLDNNGEKGTKIDSSRDRDLPFPFTVGQRGLIAGWNEGVLGMKVGGLREIYVPYQLGYGEAGRPPTLPGKSDLLFEMELLQTE